MMRFFSILLAVLTAFSGLNTVAQEAPSWAATPALWKVSDADTEVFICLLYTSPSPRDLSTPRMPSSA